ncbi:MAG: hypothetical protein VX938_03815, partial [Myxococcota bacterium]|nr:hypothetical protein [Myxococcota bacterium]
VVTDGPDTAVRSEAMDNCQSSYSNTSHTDVLEAIEAETSKAATGQDHVDVHMHFVQFESPGYLGRDLRQMEVACVTEGQYQYINSEQMGKQGSVLQEALEVALDGVRYSLSGLWQLAVEDAALTSSDSSVGQAYALDGELVVTASASLYELKACKDGKQEVVGGSCENTTDCTGANPDATCRSSDGRCVVCTAYEYKPQEKLNLFGIGRGEEIFTATSWDRRPVVRKPCSSSGSCGAPDGSETECQLYCSPELLVCPAAADGYSLPDGESCAGGKCCGGTCVDTNICPSCQ